MKNEELADLFEKMADILEFKGENPFKISAYRKASRIIGDLTQCYLLRYPDGMGRRIGRII